MPLDEHPSLVGLVIAVQRVAVEDVYRALRAAGYGDLDPASAALFQHIRPGGSSLGEIARLGHLSPAAVEEQARALAAAGYLRFVQQGHVALTGRGEAAVAAGMAALAAIEARWRQDLGEQAFAAFASALARINLGRPIP